MKPFEFKVISKCYQDASRLPGDDADFYLEENDWNDYHFYVLYHLHVTKRITGTKNLLLGYVRIMKVGQKEQEKYLLAKTFGNKTFRELPKDFVSISLEYDLYKWLSFRPVEERQALAKQLHMILSNHSEYYMMVKDDPCFQNAMLRDSTMDNYILHKADHWINQVERRYNLRTQKVTLKYDNCDEPIDLSFSCLNEIESNDIPNGIVTFIGANGSGKSTALYSLAKAMYLFPEDRDKLKRQFCKISPNDIGVERLILISYSPFDNFTIPSTENFALREIQGQTREEDGRFVYCGIRDISEEYHKMNDKGEQKDIVYLQADRQKESIAKTQERLSADFACAFGKLIENGEDNGERYGMWMKIAEKANDMHPDLNEKMLQMANVRGLDEWQSIFMDLSTGYKFFFHSMAYVINYIQEGSLVLFDEPENHIHPPLLSFMMAQYREILAKYQSVMLVATHSPVVIQEMFADNVLKVYRNGDKIHIRKPCIETYGATFGEINSEVFGLTADVSKYFAAIDSIYDTWQLSSAGSASDMLKILQEHLNRTVSNQVASYLISKFYSENPDKN